MSNVTERLLFAALLVLACAGLARAGAAGASSPLHPLYEKAGPRTAATAVPPSLRRAIDQTLGPAWSQQAQINNPGSGVIASAVALSADGTEALIQDGGGGVVYVYAKSGDVWFEDAELSPSGSSGDFGASVALSADGTTAIVGAPNGTVGDSYRGTAYVFHEANGAWTQTAELSAYDGMQADDFGSSVALSSDGTTAFIGAPGHGNYSGAAYVFNENFGAWTQTDEFTAAGQVLLGESVALSADGTIAIAGAPIHDSYTGIVYVYTKDAGTWTQTASLTASDGMNHEDFGHAVALSVDGTTALVGADWRSNYTGVAYVFNEAGGTWTQTAELSAFDGQSSDEFGRSVAISSNGTAALIGAHGHLTNTGAAYVFTASENQWSETAELIASNGTQYNYFGTSVALSGDGATALIGAPGYDGVGAAYVFTGPMAPAQALFQPSSGPPGSVTHVLGAGFTPGERVDLSVGRLTGHVHADANGNFDIALRVPNVPRRTYTLSAAGESSGASAQATFTVTASSPWASPSIPSDWFIGHR